MALEQRQRRRLDLRPCGPPPCPRASPSCPLPHRPPVVQTPPPRPPCAAARRIPAICAVSPLPGAARHAPSS